MTVRVSVFASPGMRSNKIHTLLILFIKHIFYAHGLVSDNCRVRSITRTARERERERAMRTNKFYEKQEREEDEEEESEKEIGSG